MGQEAYAYFDPATASFLLQLLIGGIVAVSVTTKLYWQKLKLFFTGNKQQIDNEHKPTSEVEENKSANDKWWTPAKFILRSQWVEFSGTIKLGILL